MLEDRRFDAIETENLDASPIDHRLSGNLSSFEDDAARVLEGPTLKEAMYHAKLAAQAVKGVVAKEAANLRADATIVESKVKEEGKDVYNKMEYAKEKIEEEGKDLYKKMGSAKEKIEREGVDVKKRTEKIIYGEQGREEKLRQYGDDKVGSSGPDVKGVTKESEEMRRGY